MGCEWAIMMDGERGREVVVGNSNPLSTQLTKTPSSARICAGLLSARELVHPALRLTSAGPSES
jgi:hypothetical protein